MNLTVNENRLTPWSTESAITTSFNSKRERNARGYLRIISPTIYRENEWRPVYVLTTNSYDQLMFTSYTRFEFEIVHSIFIIIHFYWYVNTIYFIWTNSWESLLFDEQASPIIAYRCRNRLYIGSRN